DERLAGEVAHLCRQYEVDTLVVGLPLNMDGTAGPEAERARRLAQRLRDQLGLPVVEWGERLSTAAAERMLVAAGLSRARRRRVRDKVAAAVILQSYLDSRARRATRDGAPAAGAPAAGSGAAGGSAGDAWESGRQGTSIRRGLFLLSVREPPGRMVPIVGEVKKMEEIETVVFRDEDGEEIEFEVLDFIEVDDREYVIVAMPDSDDEAFILRVETDQQGNETYVTIEDDAEWDRVAEAYEELLDEEDDEDLDDFGDDGEEDEEDDGEDEDA